VDCCSLATGCGQLDPNKTTLTTGRADVQYFVRANVALGAGNWYEQYRSIDPISFSTCRRSGDLTVVGSVLLPSA
jgi:hypothetical protein